MNKFNCENCCCEFDLLEIYEVFDGVTDEFISVSELCEECADSLREDGYNLCSVTKNGKLIWEVK